MRIATVVNISRAIEELKELASGRSGSTPRRPDAYDAVDYTLPTALVFGAEGTGLRRLVRETCDRLVVDPDGGQVASLNVSVTAGVGAVRGGPPAPGGGGRL